MNHPTVYVMVHKWRWGGGREHRARKIQGIVKWRSENVATEKRRQSGEIYCAQGSNEEKTRIPPRLNRQSEGNGKLRRRRVRGTKNRPKIWKLVTKMPHSSLNLVEQRWHEQHHRPCPSVQTPAHTVVHDHCWRSLEHLLLLNRWFKGQNVWFSICATTY